MTDRRTKLDKVRAIAATAEYNPAEAAVAASKVAAMEAGEGRTQVALEAIATDIKAEWGKGIDSQFAIGRLLNDARALFPGDTEFGRWVAAQEFPFAKTRVYYLRQAALREDAVRAFIAARLSGGERDILPTGAVKLMTARENENKPITDVGPTGDIFERAIETMNSAADEVLAALRLPEWPDRNTYKVDEDGDRYPFRIADEEWEARIERATRTAKIAVAFVRRLEELR